MTPAERKVAQQAEAQRQQSVDPLRAELNQAAVAVGIRVGSLWLRPEEDVVQAAMRAERAVDVATRIGPGPDRPETHSK